MVPDCIGNREYVNSGVNALVPPAELDALVAAIAQLDDARYAEALVAAGKTTAAKFGLASERAKFHAILDEMDSLWAN